MSDSKLLPLSQPPVASIQGSTQPVRRLTQVAVPSRTPRRAVVRRGASPTVTVDRYSPPSPTVTLERVGLNSDRDRNRISPKRSPLRADHTVHVASPHSNNLIQLGNLEQNNSQLPPLAHTHSHQGVIVAQEKESPKSFQQRTVVQDNGANNLHIHKAHVSNSRPSTPSRIYPVALGRLELSNDVMNHSNTSGTSESPGRSSCSNRGSCSMSFGNSNHSGKSNNDEDLDDELDKLGFNVVDKVLVLDDTGNVLAQYVKVESNFGQTALIELDSDGYVSIDPHDEIFEVTEVPDLPYLGVEGYKIEEPLISGVSYQCTNGVCVRVAGGETRSFIHSNKSKCGCNKGFHSNDKENGSHSPCKLNNGDSGHTGGPFGCSNHSQGDDKQCILGVSNVGHPVLKLSKVRAHPVEVQTNLKSATKKIRTNDFNRVQKSLVDTGKNLHELAKHYEVFFNKQRTAIGNLTHSIKQLEGFQQIYLSKPVLTDIEKQKCDKVAYELRKRYQKLDNLLCIDKRIKILDDLVLESYEEIKDLNSYIDDEYTGFQFVSR